MKYHETTFEEYLRVSYRQDIHPEVTECIEQLPAIIQQCPSIILYGPSGVGKYTLALRIIEKYSPSRLKFIRRIALQELSTPSAAAVTTTTTSSSEKEKEKDKEWLFRVSDIHYEVDFSLLGCESKKMWNDFFFQIADIVSVQPERSGIILCHNFHCIHNELLDVFYSYMQHSASLLHIHLVFVILTQHISFLPSCIIQRCQTIPVGRPSDDAYHFLLPKGENSSSSSSSSSSSLFGNAGGAALLQAVPKDAILNLKDVKSFGKLRQLEDLPPDLFNLVCDNIVRHMDHMMTMPEEKVASTKEKDIEMYAMFRDCLYDILLYSLDITECLWYIVDHYLGSGQLQENQLPAMLDRMHVFLKYYNNNYRPIYHLESMFYYLIMSIHPQTK